MGCRTGSDPAKPAREGRLTTWTGYYGGSTKGAYDLRSDGSKHESPKTTKLYDRTSDQITLEEVDRMGIYSTDFPVWITISLGAFCCSSSNASNEAKGVLLVAATLTQSLYLIYLIVTSMSLLVHAIAS